MFRFVITISTTVANQSGEIGAWFCDSFCGAGKFYRYFLLSWLRSRSRYHNKRSASKQNKQAEKSESISFLRMQRNLSPCSPCRALAQSKSRRESEYLTQSSGKSGRCVGPAATGRWHCCRLRCLGHQRWRRGWTSSQCDWMSRRETAEKRSASNEIRIQITFDLKIKNHRVMAAISFHYFLVSVHRSPQSRENIKDDSLTGWQSTGRSISLRV